MSPDLGETWRDNAVNCREEARESDRKLLKAIAIRYSNLRWMVMVPLTRPDQVRYCRAKSGRAGR